MPVNTAVAPEPAGPLARWVQLARLVRLPNLLIIVLTMTLTQACLLAPERPLPALLDVRFGLVVLATVCVAAAGYIINDYYDVKIDAINRPGTLVVGQAVGRRSAMMAHLVLSFEGVVVAGAMSRVVGLVTAGAALLLWGYSARFKRLALLGNLSIAVLTAASVLVPELLRRTGSAAVWAYALAAFLLTVVREIIKDIEDLRGDAQHGCRTLPIVAGVARSKWVAGAFLVMMMILVGGAVLAAFGEGAWRLALWLLGAVLGPSVVLGRQLLRADRRRDFARLSLLCKLVMLGGVLSMLVLGR
ncbi:geranylgeranylglycerol-phosphate geranylgeranyltransferase [Hymenobacter sp. 15J16-1T3B]|uniref:geranylgeranylglycerol-phosphate geranylgeranyltransferase n=1 Tax=Hymenobacter sp. 15J16-1T3B TaxID=2886941 RepID=UPI001D0FCA42|nr:geranylgeranylglycerol-phosphate geranylgeranyltransferase [Hymenobacter sp. 15J16-1T3B]MCC3157892.1 geranylgeranylglycerol-phosphate geranylgeranyltransferase [Hymenobacter sp. 15J16-1T3B]